MSNIKTPCHFCTVAYGHKAGCPHPIMFQFIHEPTLRMLEQQEAQMEWELGYTAAKDKKTLPKNPSPRYKMGYEYYKLEIMGRVRRHPDHPTPQVET